MADDNTPAAGDTGAGNENPASGQQPAAPWYQGGDQELIGHIQNRGLHEKTAAEAAFELARAHREAERFIGAPAANLLKLPTDAGDAAGWRAVYERLGAPKDAADYDFSSVKFADGTEVSENFVAFARKTASDLALPKETATRITDAFVKFMEAEEAADGREAAAAAIAAKDRLAASWGPNAEANTFIADQAAAKLGIQGDVLAKLKEGLGADGVMQMFLKIGMSMGEDRFVASGGQSGNTPRSVEQAVADKAALMKDGEFTKRYLAGDTEAVRQMTALNVIIAGESDSAYRPA